MNGVDVSSAGSLVAAVLETAGYIAQQNFLDWFGGFFFYTGELLFIFSCIGGLVSVVLFGSYKMARYLIVGPWLFIFALAYTVETDGVVWRLGNEGRIHLRDVTIGNQGVAQDIEKAARETQTLAKSNRTTDFQDIRQGTPPANQSITVSGLFYMYTNTINHIVAEFVDLVLQIGEQMNNDDAVLINNIRGQMMESILEIAPRERGLITMIEEDLFSTACGAKYSLAIAAGKQDFHENAVQQAQDNLTAAQADPDQSSNAELIGMMQAAVQDRQNQKAYIEELAAKKDDILHKPSPDMLAYMKAHRQADGTNADYLSGTAAAINHWKTYHGLSSLDETTDAGWNQLASTMHVTCKHTREIVTDAIMEDAKNQYDVYIKGFFPDDVPPALETWGEEKLCKSLAIKFGGELANFAAGQSCDLSRVYGVFLMRNAIARAGMSRDVSRIKNRMRALQPTEYHKRTYARPLRQDGDDYVVEKHEIVKHKEYGIDGMLFRNNTKGNVVWVPMSEVAFIGDGRGPFDVLKAQQSYQTRELRQTLYSYALKIPYFQGVLLYLLAATYPFLCFLLLMPGKAAVWLQVPLAWLWVKSWDVGFAACLILENVLWNLFPQSDLYQDYGQMSPADIADEGLDTVLQDALKVDFTYDVHAYYLMMTMSLTSVPILTGYATLKARRAILSSFTQAPAKAAKDLGGQVSGTYGNTVINQQMQRAKMLTGMAYGGTLLNLRDQLQNPQSLFTSAHGGPGGAQFQGRATQAGAGGSGGPRLKQSWIEGGHDNQHGIGGNSSGDIGMLQGMAAIVTSGGKSGSALTAGAQKLVNTTIDMQKATMDYNAKRARMIDPYYGRYGVHRRQTESYASALDGQLGFEINDAAEQATTLYKAGLELNMKRFDAFFEMQKNLQGALFKKNPFKNPFAGMAMVAEGKDIKELFDTSLKAVKDADAEAKNKVMGTLEITPLTDEQIRQVEEALKGEGGLNSLLADTSQTLYGGLTGREALQSYYSQKILNLTPHQLNLAQRQGAVSTSYLPEGYKMVTKLAVSSPIHDVYFKKN